MPATRRRRVRTLIVLLITVDRAYRRFARRRILDWGATTVEARASLPGDELVACADVVATRAITIRAPRSAVWPWLVQMGPGRAGAYTYDWVEHLFGLDMHSATRIVPAWQHLAVGDILAGKDGEPGMRVEILEREHVLATRSAHGDWAWTFVLEPDGRGTRLISRNRIVTAGAPLPRRLGVALMEPGSLVMERRMLLGIKSRAERLAALEARLPAA